MLLDSRSGDVDGFLRGRLERTVFAPSEEYTEAARGFTYYPERNLRRLKVYDRHAEAR